MAGQITDALNETIRSEFVEGYENDKGERIFPTLEHLIERHNVPKNTVYRRAKAQEWQQQKNEYHAYYMQKVNKQRAEAAAKDLEKLDSSSITIAKAGLEKVSRDLRLALRAERDSNQPILSAKELNELLDAGLKAQKMGKLALGEAGEITKVVADDSIPTSLARLLDQLDDIAEAKSQGARHTIQ